MALSQVMPPIPGQNQAAQPIPPYGNNTIATQPGPQSNLSGTFGTVTPQGNPQQALDQWLRWVSQNYGGAQTRPGFYSGGGQYRGNLQPIVQAYNQQFGTNASVAGDDKINFGWGPEDVITSQGEWWYDNGNPNYGGVPGTMNYTGSGGGAGGTSGGAGGTTDPNDPFNADIRNRILQQLQGYSTPTDPNSPTVRAITDPYHLAQQRGLEQVRKQNAEAMYAQSENTGGGAGIDQSALNTQQQQAAERAATNEAQFTGQTVADQETQRKQMLSQLLGLGENESQFSRQLSETQREFADKLAQSDRQFAAQLAQQVQLHGADLGYQYALLEWTKTRDVTNAGA